MLIYEYQKMCIHKYCIAFLYQTALMIKIECLILLTLASVHALSVDHCNLPMYDYILWRNENNFLHQFSVFSKV